MTSLQYLGRRGPGVWLDSAGAGPFGGSPGDVPGGRRLPVRTIGDALALTRSLGFFRVYGLYGTGVPHVFTDATAAAGVEFVGGGYDLNDLALEGCRFLDAEVRGQRGAATFSTHFERCEVIALQLAAGTFQDSSLSGLVTLANGGYQQRYLHCYPKDPDTIPTLDFNGPTGFGTLVQASVYGWSGGLRIAKMTAADHLIEITSASGAHVHIEDTCTGGKIVLRGAIKVTDASPPGTTVDTSGLACLAGSP